MKKFLNYLLSNLFSIACFVFACVYLILNFTSVSKAVLFLACLFLLYYSAIFFNDFFKRYFIDKKRLIQNLIYYRINIILLLLINFAIYYLSGWRLLSALLLGCFIFGVVFLVYYYFKKERSNC